MKFRTTIELSGKTATGFEVPAEVVEALGSTRRPAVTVTLNGHTYTSTIATMGGRYLLPLSAENRAAAGVEAGDEVEVEVALDSAPREVEAPADLLGALEAAPRAREFFDALSYSLQRYWVLQIEGAKTAETRQRRIDGAVAKFLAGKQR